MAPDEGVDVATAEVSPFFLHYIRHVPLFERGPGLDGLEFGCHDFDVEQENLSWTGLI